MSHYKQRQKNNCLNCNAAVEDRFCGVCGQENIEIKESFWGIIRHFFEDITHYDGKFLSTLKLLLIKPGFLPSEYLRGRRASYLHPIRLYVFTSAFFFLIFFTFYQKNKDLITVPETTSNYKQDLEKTKKQLEKNIIKVKDTADIAELKSDLANVVDELNIINKDSTKIDSLFKASNNFNFISFSNNENRLNYTNTKQYDSFQKSLPNVQKDGFFRKRVERQNLILKERFQNNRKEFNKALFKDFKERFPQMLFVALPLFALVLKILYVRRKNFFYASHIIFSIYLYCAFFILILLSLWLSSVTSLFSSSLSTWINVGFSIFCFFYFYKAMRFFYEQGRIKTIIKFILLLFSSLFLMSLIFVLFLIFSTFTLQ